MNAENPHSRFASPKVVVDPSLLSAVATTLAHARQNPPTVHRILFMWSSLPLLLLYGTVGTAVLLLIQSLDSHWPVGFAAMMFGVATASVLDVPKAVAKLSTSVGPYRAILQFGNAFF